MRRGHGGIDAGIPPGGFGVRAAENSSPRASIWSCASLPPAFLSLESYFCATFFFRDERVNAFRSTIGIAACDIYPSSDICAIFCRTRT